ncbi:hypothetical protein STCU_00292 [Strigomonas culicis]|uniref:GOLD domain-containing protein n=1 Tax=Strigomonas culicis TaxID=28005 RepID=S9UR35_9TRYP|nr:hypothetical protein STCU_05401 [Strigomonas culicis]EPY31353.1 hypothetical protein STCU_03498 [Strigomonas culicis]EPY37006.1 hypothetical protein STCU_00292 [Strigomonas culicis]|eukprot:EPY27937.1 hypothetical protein STCU_05401 [Strigomonas culicis]
MCKLIASLLFLLCAAVLLCTSGVQAAETFGAKIEPGTTECFTEMLEAGGTLGFTFRVTDGGSFDIDATLTTTAAPPTEKFLELELFHFNEHFMAQRDTVVTRTLNEWKRVSEGSHSYTSPSVTVTKHGMPEEVTVCFNNAFSTLSPKWVSFTFIKRDVLEIDPDGLNKVEAQMEKKLHDIGSILFNLTIDANRLRLEGDADRVKVDVVAKTILLGLLLNVAVIIAMAGYQYIVMSRFLGRHGQNVNLRVTTK